MMIILFWVGVHKFKSLDASVCTLQGLDGIEAIAKLYTWNGIGYTAGVGSWNTGGLV